LLAELAPVTRGEQLSISGYEPEQVIPLAAAGPMLRRLLTLPGVSESAKPNVFELSSPAQPVEPLRLFELAHRSLVGLGPTIVFADDLHWADELSVALVHYLVRAASSIGQPLSLVVATRPSAAVGSLCESMRRVVGVDRFVAIELGPLDREAGIALARELAPQLDAVQAELVWSHAMGSPFWLELLTGASDPSTDVDAVVLDRLRAAGHDAAALVGVLSLTARPLAAEDLAEINGWPPARVAEALAPAQSLALVRRLDDGYVVLHDLIRESAVRATPEDQLRRTHRRLGRWLERAASDDRSMIEAMAHLRAAGEPALVLARRLAEGTGRRLLGRTGLAQLLAIADEADLRDPAARALVEALAQLSSELGAHEDALRLWSQQVWSTSGPEDRSRVALQASRAALALGWRREAWRQLERARRDAGQGSVPEIEVLAHEATLRRYLDRQPDQARRTAARGLDAARLLVDRSGGLESLDPSSRMAFLRATLVAADGARMGDDPAELLTLADEVLAAAGGFDDGVEISALVQGAMALRFLGRNREAEARLRRAWERAQRRVVPEAMLEAGAALGRVVLSMGRLEEAAAIVRECTALGTRLTGFRPGRTFMVTLPWLVELTAGEWAVAVDGLRIAAENEAEPHYRMHAHLERAAALARLDPDHVDGEVRSAVRSALADADVAGCRRCLAEASVRSAEALARVGAIAEAKPLVLRTTIPAADVHNLFWSRRAEIALSSQTVAPAETVAGLEGVIEEAERQELRLEVVWARLDLAAVLVRGDRPGAAAVLRKAGATAEEMGAITEARVAARILRSLGVRTWRRGVVSGGDDPLASLTGREREIAHLVAAGASNPEIASALFLSRKTVERHVSNILAKLGARNRAALAALVPT
jgi:DNA-binding NarL/FixJ family response regulator